VLEDGPISRRSNPTRVRDFLSFENQDESAEDSEVHSVLNNNRYRITRPINECMDISRYSVRQPLKPQPISTCKMSKDASINGRQFSPKRLGICKCSVGYRER